MTEAVPLMNAIPGMRPSSGQKRAARPVSSEPYEGPELPFAGLDVLWLQVTGTLCNIACRHCFITCGPKNHSHPVMSTESVLESLAEARAYGVKEYYFTGGEPFMHPEIERLIEATLAQGPLTVLTNGILIDDDLAARLAGLAAASEYSLDLRVSLDGVTAAENDPVRGRGTFVTIMAGASALRRAGLNPIFAVTTVYGHYDGNAGRLAFIERLAEMGFAPVRVKFIPPFHIGREVRRSHGYADEYRLSEGELDPGEEHQLQCGTCRTVTAKGVYPCPILIEEPGARMSGELDDALRPIKLNHPACVTCHVEGFTCRT